MSIQVDLRVRHLFDCDLQTINKNRYRTNRTSGLPADAKASRKYYLTQTALIIEVLAPTTEATDRREKALHYRQVSTLEEYVLVAQERCEATIHRRADGWRHTTWNSARDAAEFKSIGLTLPLAEIYAGLAM